jgi:hemerythrin
VLREPALPVDWTEDMSVGVESIDVHHRQVWRRIRHLANAVADGRADEVRAALRFLHGYLAEHHAEEERWMAEAGYPGAREHTRAHAEILGRVAAAVEREAVLNRKALLLTADWVARALGEHMRSEDLKLGRFWTARENLRRLAESGPGVGTSLTPLPGSVPAAVRGREESAREDEAAPGRR